MRMSRVKRGKKRKKRLLLCSVALFSLFIAGTLAYVGIGKPQEKKVENSNIDKGNEEINDREVIKKNESKEIIITAAGDCTLGNDSNFNRNTSFNKVIELSGNDYGYPMQNVKDIFANDDYTIVNLENVFTDSSNKRNKGPGIAFHFKGPKEYAKILTEGNIEGVTVANNHSFDYGEQGFKDTIKALDEEGIEYCGEDYKILKEIKGIKIGFLGYKAWSESEELKEEIKEDIEDLRKQGAKIVIPYFHWGIERDSKPNKVQVNLARHAIDSGADMVLGSHPHVMQSLENYKGKLIIYSLGNFSFGGNSNPSDKRTFMLQVKYKFENESLVGTEYKVIPATVSSVTNKNDYIPTTTDGQDSEKILNYLNQLSPTLNGEIKNDFWTIN